MTLLYAHKILSWTKLAAGGIDVSQTSFSVKAGDRLPSLSAGQKFAAVIYLAAAGSPANDDDAEVIYVDGISGDSITSCVRGQDGSTARPHNSPGAIYRIAAIISTGFISGIPQIRTDGVTEVPASANAPARLRLERLSGDTADVDPSIVIIDTPGSKTIGLGIDRSTGTLRIAPSASLGASATGLHMTSAGAFMLNTASQLGVLRVYGSTNPTLCLDQSTVGGVCKIQMNVDGVERAVVQIDVTGQTMRIDSDYDLVLAPNNTQCIKLVDTFDTLIRIEDDEPASGDFWSSVGVHGSMSFYHLEGTPDRICLKVVTAGGNVRYWEANLSATAPV